MNISGCLGVYVLELQKLCFFTSSQRVMYSKSLPQFAYKCRTYLMGIFHLKIQMPPNIDEPVIQLCLILTQILKNV